MQEFPADKLAKRAFWISMTVIGSFVAVVFIFIL